LALLTTLERLDNHTRSNIKMYRIALTNSAKQHDCCIYYFNKITLTWITKRQFNDACTSEWGLGWLRNADVIRIIDDSYFRHMTERGHSSGTESGQVLRVTSHILSMELTIAIGLAVRTIRKNVISNIKTTNWWESVFHFVYERTSFTLYELSRTLIIPLHYKRLWFNCRITGTWY